MNAIEQIDIGESTWPGRHFRWEPGNGYKYEIAVFPYGGSLGLCGAVDAGWLVVDGLSRQAHLFKGIGFLHPGYVAEKFDRLRPEHVRYVTYLIGHALGRSTPWKTPEEACQSCPACGGDPFPNMPDELCSTCEERQAEQKFPFPCPKCHEPITGKDADGRPCEDCLKRPSCHSCGWE